MSARRAFSFLKMLFTPDVHISCEKNASSGPKHVVTIPMELGDANSNPSVPPRGIGMVFHAPIRRTRKGFAFAAYSQCIVTLPRPLTRLGQPRLKGRSSYQAAHAGNYAGPVPPVTHAGLRPVCISRPEHWESPRLMQPRSKTWNISRGFPSLLSTGWP